MTMSLSFRFALGLVLVAAVAACTQGTASQETARSFDPCSQDMPPPAIDQVELSLDQPVVLPGGSAGIAWVPEDPERFWGVDMVAECWTGDRWVEVWNTRDWHEGSGAELLFPGEGANPNDAGVRAATGVILIPVGAPAGIYRVGGDQFDARFEVTTDE